MKLGRPCQPIANRLGNQTLKQIHLITALSMSKVKYLNATKIKYVHELLTQSWKFRSLALLTRFRSTSQTVKFQSVCMPTLFDSRLIKLFF